MAILDLKTCFDESGTDAESKVVVLAGYIATAADWTTVETGLQPVLDTDGAAFYHATDAEAEPRRRGIYKGWSRSKAHRSRSKAHRLTDRVAEIVASSDLIGLGISITRDGDRQPDCQFRLNSRTSGFRRPNENPRARAAICRRKRAVVNR
jgi:hypothetical protein